MKVVVKSGSPGRWESDCCGVRHQGGEVKAGGGGVGGVGAEGVNVAGYLLLTDCVGEGEVVNRILGQLVT